MSAPRRTGAIPWPSDAEVMVHHNAQSWCREHAPHCRLAGRLYVREHALKGVPTRWAAWWNEGVQAWLDGRHPSAIRVDASRPNEREEARRTALRAYWSCEWAARRHEYDCPAPDEARAVGRLSPDALTALHDWIEDQVRLAGAGRRFVDAMVGLSCGS